MSSRTYEETTGWVGWSIFAATMMIIGGSLNAFFFLPAHPLWALIVITIDALVIWALTAHGDELRDAR